MVFPFDWGLDSVENIENSFSNFRSNTISGEKGDFMSLMDKMKPNLITLLVEKGLVKAGLTTCLRRYLDWLSIF
jgi:hypothetical protein